MEVNTEEVSDEKTGKTKTDIKTTPYREGVSVRAPQEKGLKGEYYRHFVGLHEAIVTKAEIKYRDELLELHEFKEEKEWFNSKKAKKLKEKFASKEDIDKEDVIWVDKEDKSYLTSSYKKHKKTLDYVCGEIYKELSDEYSSSEEIYNKFLKSHFTGHLLKIAKLVEKTFGDGSFRILGSMEDDSESAIKVYKILKNQRRAKNKE